MRVYIDTNVLLDVMKESRENHVDSATVLKLAKQGYINATVSTQSILDAYYVFSISEKQPLEEFKAFVKEHHLEDCVIFHGKKTSAEVAEAYQQADFFVLFSNFENLPCVIVEAFASGIPVLSTAVGGIAEILSPERGILIPQGDEEALLQGMVQMLDHSSEYDREAIRQYAISTFSNDIIGRQIFEAYKDVIGKL